MNIRNLWFSRDPSKVAAALLVLIAIVMLVLLIINLFQGSDSDATRIQNSQTEQNADDT